MTHDSTSAPQPSEADFGSLGQHEHGPDFGAVFVMEGLVIVPCLIDGCRYEASFDVPSLDWQRVQL